MGCIVSAYKMDLICTVQMLKSKINKDIDHAKEFKALVKLSYTELETLRDGLIVAYNLSLKK